MRPRIQLPYLVALAFLARTAEAEGLVEEISCFSDGMTVMLNRSFPELERLITDTRAQPVVYVYNHKTRVQCGTSLKGDKGSVTYNLTIPYGKPCDVYLINLEPNFRVSETVIVLENNIAPFGQTLNHRVDCLYEQTVQTFKFNDVGSNQIVAASTGGRPKPKVEMHFISESGEPLRYAKLGDSLGFYLAVNPDNAYKAILPKECMFSDREDIAAPETQRLTFVQGSCPVQRFGDIIDPLAHVNNEVFFSKFKTFRFDNKSTIFVHCTVQVCLTTEECHQSCFKRAENSSLTAARLRFRHRRATRSTARQHEQPTEDGDLTLHDTLHVFHSEAEALRAEAAATSGGYIEPSSAHSPLSCAASPLGSLSLSSLIALSLALATLAAASVSAILYLLWRLKRTGKFSTPSALDVYSAAQLRSLANSSASIDCSSQSATTSVSTVPSYSGYSSYPTGQQTLSARNGHR